MVFKYNEMAQKQPYKIPPLFRFIRWSFPKLETLFPGLAHRWAIRLFFTPMRFPLPEREATALAAAKTFSFQYNGTSLQAYSWGKGPVVLFMHGWAGRGTQISEWVVPLTEAGYQVVALDAPAHGKSPGKRTHLLHFAKALKALGDAVGNVHAIIGHSLGGAATLLALELGLQTNHTITISTPAVSDGILREFLSRLNAKDQQGQYIADYIQQQFNLNFKSLSAEYIAQRITPPSPLIIHDENDMEAPIYHAEALLEVMPNATHYWSKELGHNRIIRNPEVLKQVLNHIHIPPQEKTHEPSLSGEIELMLYTNSNW